MAVFLHRRKSCPCQGHGQRLTKYRSSTTVTLRRFNMKRNSVLIVEDNPKEQMLLKMAFEEIGVRDNIYAVDDGDDAIAFLKRKGKFADSNRFVFPTFLLTDLKMPKVNGFELLFFLKRSNFTIIPTIVFTASDHPDDIKCAYQLGANAYHVKPVGMEGLCEKLRAIYDGRGTAPNRRKRPYSPHRLQGQAQRILASSGFHYRWRITWEILRPDLLFKCR